MFNFLKTKNCDYHIKQIDKCLETVLKNYIRAEQYLLGGGFGDKITKIESAKGAIGKSKKKLFEAYNNYCDGVEDAENHYDKIGLANAVMKYTVTINTYDVFKTDDIRDLWTKEMETFESACKKFFNYDDLKS